MSWFSSAEGLVYAARAGADGQALDPAPVAVGPALGAPRLACMEEVCLVAFVATSGRAGFRRVDAAGVWLDEQVVDVGGEPGYGTVDVAAGAGVFAVVSIHPADPRSVVGVNRFTISGDSIDEVPVVLGPDTQAGFVAAIAGTGDGFLVTWSEDLGAEPDGHDLGFALLGRSGGLIAHAPLARAPGAEGSGRPVFDGANVVVPWQRTDGAAWAIQLGRVHPSGAVLDAAPLAIREGGQVTAQLASASRGERDVLLVWDEPGPESTRLRLRLLHE